jgi:hypothetical protein
MKLGELQEALGVPVYPFDFNSFAQFILTN